MMTPDEFAAWKKAGEIKYAADLIEAAATLRPLDDVDRAVIGALYPGFRGEYETLTDVEVDRTCLKQIDKLKEALKPWLSL